VALALSLALLVFGARAAETQPPGVLILHSNQRPLPAGIVIEDTLRAVLPDALKRPVAIFSEYLDDEWSSLNAYGAAEAEFLRNKYGRRNIRVVVASAPLALRFATEFRDRMFPGVPIVHIAVPRDTLERMRLPTDIIGRPIDLDQTATLQLALRLHPGATRLVFVLGGAERDRIWERRVRAAVERLGPRIEVEYWSGLPTAEVLRRVGALPRNAVVFTPGYFVDGTGQVVTPRQSLETIAPASAAPVYGPLDTHLGTGIVGGYMTPYEDQAKQAGAIVVGLLNGATPGDTMSSPVARVPMVDWRQVRRWGIDERLLPADTVVKFRESTAWERYWREISLGAAVLLFQAALIFALLLERRSRRGTASALEESQKQMDLAAKAARLSLWTWDTTRGEIRTTAQSRQPYRGLNGPPIPFEQVVRSVHPADRESFQRAVVRTLTAGEELDIEYRTVEVDGSVRWVAARGRAPEGDSRRLSGVALDITERVAAELQAAEDHTALRHVTRVSMVGQLSAAVAHQLNQPLAAILGNAEAAQKMLGRENLDLVELRAICNDIVSEDHRASEVIRRLSALYKRGDMKVEAIDLNELIGETLDLLRTELLIRHVTPLTELAAGLPAIEGGYVQLQQVVLNLVINAADAMSGVKPEERRLAIRTESSGTVIRLYIVDNGSGIAPEHLKTVFDAFWSTKAEGMGMGLAICQSIVSAHHGSITAANNQDGGATFCVSLPAGQQA
jgi:signal transduction histidine kinase